MSAYDPPRFLWGGDGCVIVEFGDGIDTGINAMVRALAGRIEASRPSWLIETVPTYRSLAVYLDPWETCRDEAMAWIRSLCSSIETPRFAGEPAIEIPVCYGGGFGPDMERVSLHTGLPAAEIIRLHSSPVYHVFMLGFSPGFPYLGGMDQRLETPRLENPRTLIPAGSVGIAGKQTGVYPLQSPGGWNLIGRTPLKLFDPSRKNPFLVKAGMEIRFVPVSEDKYPVLPSSGEVPGR
ncbi:MAG: 5-oxoprolinase subunit PxpB [Thermovirgaceae bacterium]|nr:5-oxoprolinase subunit PxpB [Thermovirgaceae bacterium]